MKLSADRGKLLENELTEAVNAERYEDAAQISKDLAHQEKLKMHDALQKQITENIAIKPQPAVSISASPAPVEKIDVALAPLQQDNSDRKMVRSTSYFMIALTVASFFANLMIIGKAFQVCCFNNRGWQTVITTCRLERGEGGKAVLVLECMLLYHRAADIDKGCDFVPFNSFDSACCISLLSSSPRPVNDVSLRPVLPSGRPWQDFRTAEGQKAGG
eukprot:753387-Hanusia_phi.AAC.4